MLDSEIVEEVEELVRQQNMSKGTDEIASASVQARVQLGMGINLQKTCPYIKECNPAIQSTERCIGKENYRAAPCYRTQIALDAFGGRFDALAINHTNS